MLSVLVALCITFLLAGTAVAVDDGRTILSIRVAAPIDWTLDGRADSADIVNFFIALKQNNLDVLESKFWSVSNPRSPEYRQFLSIEEINEIIAPEPKLLSTVQKWLMSNGVTAQQISTFSDALEIHTSVSVAEKLFQTEFYKYHHAKWDRTVVRHFGSYSVPSYIRSLIDMVIGISNFPQVGRSHHHSKLDDSSQSPVKTNSIDYAVVGQTVYGLYNIPPQTQQNASATTSQGVIEFGGEYFVEYDLKKYSELVGIPITPIANEHIIGDNRQSYVLSTEASIDTQFITTVNIEAMTWFWTEDDSVWLYGFTTHFYNTTDVPQVISISYMFPEALQCNNVYVNECDILKVTNDEYVDRINVEFQKIGLRGVSILVASGTQGAHAGDMKCIDPTLHVDFPSSSPFVTSVGGTQLGRGSPLDPQPQICTLANVTCAAAGYEVALSEMESLYPNGGGFSELTLMPDYQKTAVSGYLASGVQLPPAGMYNTSYRAHPDISAIAHNNLFYDGLQDQIARGSGTPYATSIAAAVIALLNQASIAGSGKPLGFLNPLLYQIGAENPSAFYDVTFGDNICPGTDCTMACFGYVTAKGWDPVTGFGTPNYPVLLQEINKLTGQN